MKKYILTLYLFGFFTTLGLSQIEFKSSPVALLFNRPDFYVEYLIRGDLGLETGLSFMYGRYNGGSSGDATRNGFSFFMAGKYYFSSKDEGDRFFSGLYLNTVSAEVEEETINFFGTRVDGSYKRNSSTLGFLLGYKGRSKRRGVIIELVGGLGREFSTSIFGNPRSSGTFNNEVRPLGRLLVGFRLNQ